MAYSRFGVGGSDVYVFMHVGGFLTCCWCPMRKKSFDADSTQEMVEHLTEHIRNGDSVPDYVIPELLEDDHENFPY